MTTLTWRAGELFRDGRPHRILGGAIHYARVHPDQWRDRLERLLAMGANTLDTYVAWNFHQPHPDRAADFTGWRDLAGFLRRAQDVGLDVILRPGPYICAEWDNGGLPSWLTARPEVIPRTATPAYTEAVARWLDVLLPVVTPLQAVEGGPIVAVQVENEYGSYGDDTEHLRWLHDALAARGVTELLFTADGGSDYYLDGGELPGVLAAATYGSRGREVLEVWRRRRPGEHLINMEFWCGWFDHWGEEHHSRGAADAAAELDATLSGGGSACVYMAHGGTNFGLWAGANDLPASAEGPARIQPTVTSYDYDAPIAEDGALTEKFHRFREVFQRYHAEPLPPVPDRLLARPPAATPVGARVSRGQGLLDYLTGQPLTATSKVPSSFEQLGLDHGLVLYTAHPKISAGQVRVRLSGLHDRATVFLDGQRLGVLDETTGEAGLPLDGSGAPGRLDILVENQGRINFGPRSFEHKGILRGVLLNNRYILGWEHRGIDLDACAPPVGADPRPDRSGGWSSATLELGESVDRWLRLPGFGKGFVWVNGFLLGRYWSIGPQLKLYAPAPLWRAGPNVIDVLELEHDGPAVELDRG